MSKKNDFSLSIGINSYRKNIRKAWIVLLFLIIIVFGCTLISVSIGSANISFVDIMKAFFGFGDKMATTAVWNLRMRRIVGAIVAGAGLAISGTVMQTCLRNPLASPSTIGVSSAATFGANIAILGFGAGAVSASGTFNNPYLVTLCAFIASVGAILLIMGISKFQNFSAESIILAGTALSALFSAGTTLLQYFGTEDSISAAVFWTFGDLERLHWVEIGAIFGLLMACLIFFMLNSWNYNAMATGEETAKSLGSRTHLIRIFGLLVSALLTSVIVSFVGMIGFIGLVAPQIIKRIIGQDHRFFLPASALTGSAILLIADTIARTVVSPIVLPIGAITSILGAPVFIFILLKGLRK